MMAFQLAALVAAAAVSAVLAVKLHILEPYKVGRLMAFMTRRGRYCRLSDGALDRGDRLRGG